jgi:hypothetical protein
MTQERPKCRQCRQFVEPPNATMRMRDESEKIIEFPLCVECWEKMRAQDEADTELEPAMRRGERCYFCTDELDPPGGFTLQSPDGQPNSLVSLPKIIRVCRHCRDANSTH